MALDPATESSQPAFLVFGAGGGIGSRLIQRLAQRPGARLALAGRDEGKLVALAASLEKTETLTHVLDARDFAGVEHATRATVERFSRLDGVANCVGSILLKPAHLTTPDEWAETLTTNLTSAFAVTRAAAAVMMKADGGSIALVSSAAARHGLFNHEAIAAAKAGVIGLTQSAAATYARYNIRVNCAAPGLVQTPLTRRLTESDTSRQASEAMHALGRLGTPDDVASLLDWLLDPRNNWVTGQVIGVDGGLATARSRG